MRQVITIIDKIDKEPTCLTEERVINNMKLIISKKRNDEEKKSEVNSKYYRGENSEVVIALQKIYGKKCAFCECELQKPEIEHFRPQNLNQYYWLGYEWTNLLPICEICNGAKGDKFPIMGISACDIKHFLDVSTNLDKNLCKANSTILLAEKSLLIHPELENPIDFFAFLPNGKLSGIDTQGKGETTIAVYGLNEEKMGNERIERAVLIKERKRILDDMIEHINFGIRNYNDWITTIKQEENGLNLSNNLIWNKILSWFGKYPAKTELPNLRKKAKTDFVEVIETEIKILHNRKNVKHTYSFVYNYIWDNFDHFLLSQFPEKIAKDIKTIFDRYNDF